MMVTDQDVGGRIILLSTSHLNSQFSHSNDPVGLLSCGKSEEPSHSSAAQKLSSGDNEQNAPLKGVPVTCLRRLIYEIRI